jgi:hypothetical protein
MAKAKSEQAPVSIERCGDSRITVSTVGAVSEIERLAQWGWRLLPCAVRGKTPLLKRWPAVASSDLATIYEWAAQFPNCNWGVATGPDSRVFVLDVDGEQGRASLSSLERQYGPLPPTLTSRTGRGEHRWFNYPGAREIRGSAGKLGQGLDIRGSGGYAIVPPSVHSSGRLYQWGERISARTESWLLVGDAPSWLLDLLSDKNRGNSPSQSERVGIVVEGQRNDVLFRFACAMRRRGATQEEIERKLIQKNERECRPKLEVDEVRKIATGAANYEPGGPDPLETAWEAVLSESHARGYEQFKALARTLQLARPVLLIALPLKRIGGLMECDWTQVRRWRQRAECEGWLCLKERHIPHLKAALYIFNEFPAASVPLKSVRRPANRALRPGPRFSSLRSDGKFSETVPLMPDDPLVDCRIVNVTIAISSNPM